MEGSGLRVWYSLVIGHHGVPRVAANQVGSKRKGGLRPYDAGPNQQSFFRFCCLLHHLSATGASVETVSTIMDQISSIALDSNRNLAATYSGN